MQSLPHTHAVCATVSDITSHKYDAYIVDGDSLRLTCQLSSNSSVNCSTPFFTRSGKQSLGSHVQQRVVFESTVELEIEHVSAVDQGNYFCYTGSDDGPTLNSDGITLFVTSRFSCIIATIIVVVIS